MKKTPKITPRAKQVLVQPDGAESRQSAHGIFVPSNIEQEQKAIGTVMAVGPEIKDLKKGDRVIFGTYSGDQVVLDKVTYKLIYDDEILAILE